METAGVKYQGGLCGKYPEILRENVRGETKGEHPGEIPGSPCMITSVYV